MWKEDDLYHARRIDLPERPQVCLPLDLFEVIAELAGLDLEHATQAAEATSLARHAQMELEQPRPPLGSDHEAESDSDEDGTSASRTSAP